MKRFIAVMYLVLIASASGSTAPIKSVPQQISEAIHEAYIEEIARAQERAPDRSLLRLRGDAQTRAQDIMDQLTDLYDLPRYELPTIRWSLRDYRAGAVTPCTDPEPKIMILNEILYLRNYNRFMEQTIPHEVAHIVACMLAPENYTDPETNPHDQKWAEVMSVMGRPPAEFHTMDVTAIDLYNKRVDVIMLEFIVDGQFVLFPIF